MLCLVLVFCSKLSLIVCLTRLAGAGVAPVVVTPRRLPHLPLSLPHLHHLHQPGHVGLLVPDHPHPRPRELVPLYSEGHAGVRHHAPGVGSGVVTVPERDLVKALLVNGQI